MAKEDAQKAAHDKAAEDLREKVKSIGQVKSGPKVHVAQNEGPLSRKQQAAGVQIGDVAGIHLVHDDGRIDAVVGGHPDDADYWEFKTRQIEQDGTAGNVDSEQ